MLGCCPVDLWLVKSAIVPNWHEHGSVGIGTMRVQNQILDRHPSPRAASEEMGEQPARATNMLEMIILPRFCTEILAF